MTILTLGLAFGYFVESGYSQIDTTEQREQTTLSGNLLNSPLAQDILEKN